MTIHQDVDLHAALLAPDGRCSHAFATGRRAWLQVARGAVEADGTRLARATVPPSRRPYLVTLVGVEEAEVLLFDLA